MGFFYTEVMILEMKLKMLMVYAFAGAITSLVLNSISDIFYKIYKGKQIYKRLKTYNVLSGINEVCNAQSEFYLICI